MGELELTFQTSHPKKWNKDKEKLDITVDKKKCSIAGKQAENVIEKTSRRKIKTY